MSGGIVKREGLIKVLQRQRELTYVRIGNLRRPVTSHQDLRLPEPLAQIQHFLSKLAGGPEFRPQCMKCPEPPEGFTRLRRVA